MEIINLISEREVRLSRMHMAQLLKGDKRVNLKELEKIYEDNEETDKGIMEFFSELLF